MLGQRVQAELTKQHCSTGQVLHEEVTVTTNILFSSDTT